MPKHEGQHFKTVQKLIRKNKLMFKRKTGALEAYLVEPSSISMRLK